MKVRDYEIFSLHAEFCKTLGHPKRLVIITALSVKAMTVGELAELLDVPVSNVSQHLKILRDKEIVTAKKQAQNVYYTLSDKRLIDACNTIRKIIVDLYKQKGKIIGEGIDPTSLLEF